MKLENKVCSVKNCEKIAFYFADNKFFCEDHKELACKKAKIDTYDHDYHSHAKYRNDDRINKLSKIK